MMPVIIIGGLRFGFFTPTEAAVVAAVYALLVATLIYRELSLRACTACWWMPAAPPAS
jgi:TRAP-type transport system large permease protein